MIITISGTPGTGKTKIAKMLSKKTRIKLIRLSQFIKKHKLYCGYDAKRKTLIVDPKRLKKRVQKLINEQDVIIEGHLAHFIPSDLAFILRLDPKHLEERLKRRGWNSEKVRENVSAEILSIIYWEALQNNKRVLQIDTTGKSSDAVVKRILNILKSKKYRSDEVEWLEKYQEYLSDCCEKEDTRRGRASFI
ncbi:MAG: adenylate kinase family protein [Candidatus Aenigmatarchaeota archaeon]